MKDGVSSTAVRPFSPFGQNGASSFLGSKYVSFDDGGHLYTRVGLKRTKYDTIGSESSREVGQSDGFAMAVLDSGPSLSQ